MNQLAHWATAALCLLYPMAHWASTGADSSNYQIECILWQQPDPLAQTDEPALGAAPLHQAPSDQPNTLDKTHWQLRNVEQHLKAHGAKLLGHWAWQQHFDHTTIHFPLSIPVADHQPQTNYGEITIHKRHFFEVTVQCQLPASIQPSTTPSSGRWVLREDRRIRSNEANYFDHPKIGLLLLITKLTSSIN